MASLDGRTKQILSQTEQRLTERQNKILEAFKGAEDQIAAANKELNTSISGTLDTMDDKITKILIANKILISNSR